MANGEGIVIHVTYGPDKVDERPFITPGPAPMGMTVSTRPCDWAEPARSILFTETEQLADLRRQQRRQA
jgi:hypothetical protein